MVSHTQPKSHIDSSSSSLEDTKSPDYRERHPVLGLVNTEVLEGPLGLSTPVLVRGDLNLAKGVGLGSGSGHLQCRSVQASVGRFIRRRESRRYPRGGG